MNITTKQFSGISIICPEGKLTLQTCNDELRQAVLSAINFNTHSVKVIINLSAVTLVDSSGMGELVGAHTSVVNRGGMLRFCNIPAKLNALLHITQLITIFNVDTDEKQAIQRLLNC